jgi:hypothetical protein
MKKIAKKIRQKKSFKLAALLLFILLGFIIEKLHLTKLAMTLTKNTVSQIAHGETTDGCSSTATSGDCSRDCGESTGSCGNSSS